MHSSLCFSWSARMPWSFEPWPRPPATGSAIIVASMSKYTSSAAAASSVTSSVNLVQLYTVMDASLNRMSPLRNFITCFSASFRRPYLFRNQSYTYTCIGDRGVPCASSTVSASILSR